MKAELIAAATGKGTEPKHAGLLYSKMDLVKALNHYNVYAKPESLKAWALTWLHKHHPELVKVVEKQPVGAFGTYGALCRMSERGFDHDDASMKRIYDYFAAMKVVKAEKPEEPKTVAPKAKIYSRSREAFELAIDETLSTGKVVMPSLIMSESHKDIADICNQILKEIEECPEGYGTVKNLTVKFCKAVLEKVEKVKSVKKASPASVTKNPAKAVAGVKYLRKWECKHKLGTFGLKSIDPIDCLERKKMYVFDAKYRRLICFVAMTAAGFQFTGTTLKNVDLKKSFSKTIRKPEDFFTATTIGIAELNKAFDNINGKATPMVASRFNSDWLILRVTEKGA